MRNPLHSCSLLRALSISTAATLLLSASATELGLANGGSQDIRPIQSGESNSDPDEVREEARRAIRDETSTPEMLVALSDRALALGLSADGIRLLDAALDREPDHGPTLERVLALGERIRLDLPLPKAPEVWDLDDDALVDAIDRCFVVAPRYSRSMRELVVVRLADALFPEVVEAACLKHLVAADEGRRAFAALTLRRLRPGRAIAPLIERSLLDTGLEVRREASLALMQIEDPAVAAPAVRALTASRPILRLHGAQAIGWMGYTEAIPPLASALIASDASASAPRAHVFFGSQSAYVQDFDVEVAAYDSIADPVIGVLPAGAVLDVRAIGVSSSPRRFERAAMESLRRLSGEDAGPKRKNWERWWSDSDHNPANAGRAKE